MSYTPTRLVNGVTIAPKGTALAKFRTPVAFDTSTYFNDFFDYAAADWTVTNTTSHGTAALTAGAGGLMSLAGGASSVTNDIVAIIDNPLSFNLPVNASSSSKPPTAQAWFRGTMYATTAANDQLQIGVTSANSALTPADGIYFNKAAGSAAITFVVRAGSASLAATAYSTGTTTVATLADATKTRLDWHYDGDGYVEVYVNDAMVCRVNVGGSTGAVVATFPQAVAMGAGFGIKAAATAPTTGNLVVDYLLVAQDRSQA
jgi:hypothetical protein